ncbi:hypothetical protein C8F01DRAFT_1371103 [Mycena amicta]|nr:hypothetical protein C8F01DRAFT_1371103 [Mycena amicta]
MHSSLRLSNVNRLPPRERALALAALRGNEDDRSELGALVDRLPERHLPLMAPIFYVHLETADIAVLSDSDMPTRQEIVHRVLSAMGFVAELANRRALVTEAFYDLWPRIWAWIESLEPFCDLLQNHSRYYHACTDVYLAFLSFRTDGALKVAARISPTPGLRCSVAKAWAYFVAIRSPSALTKISEILLEDDELKDGASNPHLLDEILAGAGGSYEHLASLVVAHFRWVLPQWDVDVDDPARDTASSIWGVLAFIDRNSRTRPKFREALVEGGITTGLTTALRAFSISPREPDIINIPLSLMRFCFVEMYPQGPFVQSLRAGLLPALFACAVNPSEAVDVTDLLNSFFGTDFLRLTMYHSVLVQLERSLHEIRHLDPAVHFPEPILKLWREFVALVNERLRILASYRKGELTPYRVCDNLKCAKVSEKKKLKRCTGCYSAYYCDQTCQKADYVAGQHRVHCSKLNEHRSATNLGRSAQDRAFFRALLNHDYLLHEEYITLEILRYLHPPSARSRTPCVFFDYTSGICRVSVHEYPAERNQLRPVVEAHQIEYAERYRDGDDVQIHMVKAPWAVSHDENERAVVADRKAEILPFRSSGKRLLRGLRALAETLPPMEASQNVNYARGRHRVQILIALEGPRTH